MIFSNISDDPITDATLFGFDKKADELMTFLTSKDTITPFVVAIHGEWGSGKSSLLLTIKKKIEKKIKDSSLNMKVVYFDAWAYESTNPAAALVYKMLEPLQSDNLESAKNIAKLALDLVTRNVLNMKLDDMRSHFDSTVNGSETLDKHIRDALNTSIPDGRLIVLIDDLDRCTIENTLTVLDSIKLFLSIEGCLFVVAVDMPKIELAWKSRYGNDVELLREGTSYLEKIFQMRIGVPPKKNDEIKKFVQKINDNCSEDIAELISIAGPKNLRKIKRLINLASYRSSTVSGHPKKFDLSIMWSLFEYIIGNNTKAARFYEYLPKETGHSFLKYISDVIPFDSKFYVEHIDKNPAFAKIGGVPSHNDEKLKQFFEQCRWIIQSYKDHTWTSLDESLDEIVHSSEETD